MLSEPSEPEMKMKASTWTTKSSMVSQISTTAPGEDWDSRPELRWCATYVKDPVIKEY